MHDAHVHIHEEAIILENVECIANVQNVKEYAFLSSFDNLHISVGLHPWDVENVDYESLVPLFDLADCIGEIGMDNVWTQTDLNLQRLYFEKQLALATQMHKPVILHTKGMEKSIVDLIRHYPNSYLVHWYSCMDYLQEYIDYGCWFTIGPSILTDPAVKQVANLVPLDKLLIETDGLSALEWCEGHPISPSQYRFYLQRTIHELSIIRSIPEAKMEEILDTNFHHFLKSTV